jgi:predicted hydrocarbon binding protein
MKDSTPAFFYPNKLGRIILLALEEILGNNGITAVLNHTQLQKFINNYPKNNLNQEFNFLYLAQIQKGLEEIYGSRGGQGLALRSGRTCFKYGLKEFNKLLGVSDSTFKLLPLTRKIEAGAAIFASLFNNISDQKVRVEKTKKQINWYIDKCPVCWGRKSNKPICHLAVGVLQEALFWVSGGRFFDVDESECIAQGYNACKIRVSLQPLN